jgi:hypothetical protein
MKLQTIDSRELNPIFQRKAVRREPSQRTLLQKEAEAYLSSIPLGDGAVIFLEEGEDREKVKRRFKSAAKRLGLRIRFGRSSPDRLIFQILGKGDLNV